MLGHGLCASIIVILATLVMVMLVFEALTNKVLKKENDGQSEFSTNCWLLKGHSGHLKEILNSGMPHKFPKFLKVWQLKGPYKGHFGNLRGCKLIGHG